MYGQESASGRGLSSLPSCWPPVLLSLMESRSEQAEGGWKYQSQPRAFPFPFSAPGNDNVKLTAETLSSSIPCPLLRGRSHFIRRKSRTMERFSPSCFYSASLITRRNIHIWRKRSYEQMPSRQQTSVNSKQRLSEKEPNCVRSWPLVHC